MENISAYHFGFVLGPCINASGRLETARIALQLFLEKDYERACQIAEELVELNLQRKDMTAEGVERAKAAVEAGNVGEKVLVIFLPEVHESLAGIIAGRIRESYHKPVFVLTRSEDGVKGSGRSIEEYSMYEELCRCKELLTRFGGHPMAAGLSMKEEDVPKLRQQLNEYSRLTDEDFIPKIKIDIPMPVSYPGLELIREFEVLEPFGKANTKPLFADKNLAVAKAAVIGRNQNVLRLTLVTEQGVQVPAVYFGDVEAFRADMTEKYGEKELKAAFSGRTNAIRLSVIYYPEINVYQGMQNIQIIIRNYR
jgi:single-stranded-DNA-specific exonuclease